MTPYQFARDTLKVSEITRNHIPDAEGNLVPASVHEGSAEISGSQGENEHILVAFEAGVYNVQKATCSVFCTTCDGWVQSFLVVIPFAVAVAGNTQETFGVQYNTGYQYDRTNSSSWSTSNVSVATVNVGLVNGVAAGTATLYVTGGLEPQFDHPCNFSYPPPNCPSRYIFPGGEGPGSVRPTISQDKPLWFFGLGNTPPGSFTLGAISATLTANGAGNGTYVWTITNGTPKATLENNSSTITKINVNTVGISSTSYSTQANDVTVQLQFTPTGGSQVSVNWDFSIDSPYKLLSTGTTVNNGVAYIGVQSCSTLQSGSNGFISFVPYRIQSFFGVQISNEYINESFTTQIDDYIGNNWFVYTAGAFLSSDGTFSDRICAVAAAGALTPPAMPPQNPLLTVRIDHASQSWFVGSQTTASGVQVQANILQRFQDHGTHTSVQSPVR